MMQEQPYSSIPPPPRKGLRGLPLHRRTECDGAVAAPRGISQDIHHLFWKKADIRYKQNSRAGDGFLRSVIALRRSTVTGSFHGFNVEMT